MAAKQYSLDEFIDLLKQAKAHLERADQANASLTARQAALAETDAQLSAKQTALATIESDYSAKASQLDQMHHARLQKFDAEALQYEANADASSKERAETHERTIQKLTQRIAQLNLELTAVTEQRAKAQASLDAVQAALEKTKKEAKAFSALLS